MKITNQELNQVFSNSTFYQKLITKEENFDCQFYNNYMLIRTYDHYYYDKENEVKDIYFIKCSKLDKNQYKLLIIKNNVYNSEEFIYFENELLQNNTSKRLFKQKK